MIVYKSDKTYEEFSQDKVRKGICEAYNSIGEKCQDELIDSIISNLFIYEKISSKEIRRQVEESLMSINKKVAKAYIEKYKEIDEDNKALKDKDDFIQSYIKASNASTGSKYDSNANVCNKNIATLNAEIPKRNNIKFNRYNTSNKIANLYSKKLAKQYVNDLESHIIYKHDESTFGINSPYTYSAKETVEVKYNDRHLMLPFDLLWELLEEDEVLVNEMDGAWQKYPKNLYVKDKGNVFTHVSVMTKKLRKRDLVRVKTSFGEDVIVTDNHPMIVYEDDINNTVEAINSKDYNQFKIDEKLEFDGNKCLDGKSIAADEELGYLVGYFVGNESSKFDDVNEDMQYILKEVFNVKDDIKDRILPYNMFEYNEGFVKGLLGGVIDANAVMSNSTFEIQLKSRALAMQLNSLLRHFNYEIDNSIENGLWVINCSVRNDSTKIECCDKLKNVRISESSLKYKKDGKTTISSVTKIEENDAFLGLNEFIYDITTDSRTFALNNLLVHNCVAIQSYPFLTNGLKTLGGLSAAPKNLDSFCGMFVNLIFAVSSQFAGACLYKDQKLLISNNGELKSIKIKDFVNSFELDNSFSNYQGEWEYKDISDKNIMVAEDNKLVKVKKVFRRKYDKDIYHIKSHGLLECFVSEDHRFKSLFRGREIELKAKELELNETVFVDKDYTYLVDKNSFDYRNGQFIGLVCGDGNITNDYDFRVSINSQQMFINDFLFNYVKDVYNREGRFYYDKRGYTNGSFRLSSKEIVSDVRKQLIPQERYDTYTKNVDITNKSIDFQIGFLDGLLTSDGTFSLGKGFKLSLTNGDLVNTVKEILVNLNINKPVISTYEPKIPNRRKLYTIHVPLKMIKYFDLVLKKPNLSSLKKYENGYSFDEWCKEKYWIGANGKKTVQSNKNSPIGAMKDNSVKNLKIDTIESIETFKNDDEYVYEIETETHWYNCGGFITHNCAVSGALLMFEYYCRKEWGDDYYLHDDRTAKIKYNKDGKEEKITISKQIDQYFQQIVYSINQPAAARGFQAAFVNFAYFDKPYFDGMYGEFKFPDGTKPSWESLSYIQKKFMKWFNKERTKCVLTFPVNYKSAA